MQKLHYISRLLDQYLAMPRVEIVTHYSQCGGNNYKSQPYLTTLPYESELHMASGLGISLWHIENSTNIIYVYSALMCYLQMFLNMPHSPQPYGIGVNEELPDQYVISVYILLLKPWRVLKPTRLLGLTTFLHGCY